MKQNNITKLQILYMISFYFLNIRPQAINYNPMSNYNYFIFVSKFEIYLYYIFYKKPLIIHLT